MTKNEILKKTELFVLDMDGTFYLSDTVIDGSLEFLDEVKRAHKKYIFFTNNSSKDKKLYIEKLARMNCMIGYDYIMTSGDVTIERLNSTKPGKTVYLLGTPALEKSFEDGGIRLTNGTDEVPDIVVVGFDMTLTYEKLERACTYIRNGAEFIATHPDINCPVEGGFIPDCGAFIAAISLSTGKEPKVFGKPNRETMEAIVQKTGIQKEKIAFVGDRIYTDVATGVNNGAMGILVMSGETTEEILEASSTRPDAVFSNLGEMARMLSRMNEKQI